MLQRPIYQTAVALLSLAALAGGLWLLIEPTGSPGLEIVAPGTPGPSSAGTFPTPSPADGLALININSASAVEMDAALPGIGPTLSQRIVDYREANGPFERTDELMAVRGIGPAIYEGLRELVTVAE